MIFINKKNLNPDTAERLAKELEACARESAKLDEKMLQIRDRITEDSAAASDRLQNHTDC